MHLLSQATPGSQVRPCGDRGCTYVVGDTDTNVIARVGVGTESPSASLVANASVCGPKERRVRCLPSAQCGPSVSACHPASGPHVRDRKFLTRHGFASAN